MQSNLNLQILHPTNPATVHYTKLAKRMVTELTDAECKALRENPPLLLQGKVSKMYQNMYDLLSSGNPEHEIQILRSDYPELKIGIKIFLDIYRILRSGNPDYKIMIGIYLDMYRILTLDNPECMIVIELIYHALNQEIFAQIFPLNKLPVNVANLVAAYTGAPSITKLFQLSNSINTLFKPLLKSRAAELLCAVKKANYGIAKSIIDIDENFMLMFEHVCHENEMISPLKLAFKLNDSYMWKKTFLNKIEKIKSPDCMPLFNQQLQEQVEHIDLKPLFKAYETYAQQANLWYCKKISFNDLDEAWLELGKAQRLYLPWHMLKEFCRPGNAWHSQSAFSTEKLPPPPAKCEIYDCSIGASKLFLLHEFHASWDGTLMRDQQTVVCLSLHGFVWNRCKSDVETFRCLSTARANDIVKQKSMLKDSCQNPTLTDSTMSMLC